MSECTLSKIELIKFGPINGVNRDQSLNFKVFNGRLGISIFEGKGSGRPKFSKSFNVNQKVLLMNVLEQIQAASPDTKRSMTFTKWDPNTKQSSIDYVITVGKDGSLCYYIELSWRDNSGDNAAKFPLRGLRGVSLGSDAPKDADRSANELSSLLYYLKYQVPTMEVISNTKWDPNNRGGNNNRGNSGGYNGGQQRQAPPPPTDNPEDYF